MSTIITDGRGTGSKAEVDDHGRLYVRTNHVSHLSHHSTYHLNVFVTRFEVTLPDSSETVAVVLYNSRNERDIEVFDMHVSCDAAVKLSFYRDGPYVSGGDTSTPLNLHLGSGVSPEIITYEGGASGDIVVDSTSEQKFGSVFLGSHTPSNIGTDGGLIIPGNKSFSIKATGAAGTVVTGMIIHTSHAAGTVL